MTAGGLAVAGLFLLLAIASAGLPGSMRRGAWLPVHLALAGAAAQAIGAAMPYFTVALLAGRPAPWPLRVGVQACLALGALGVTAGVVSGAAAVATSGGVVFVAGVGLLAPAAFAPLRGALGRRHRWVLAAYAVAILDVALGAGLGTLEVAGFAPAAADWHWLEPAHGWLNLLGFVSLAIAATLLHLYPTVVGSRIRSGRPARALVLGLGGGAPIVALGYVLHAPEIGRAGAIVELVGLAGLLAYAAGAWRARGQWTGDLAWRTAAIGSLGAGVAWFAVAILVSTGLVLVDGATPAAWSFEAFAAPIVVGWTAQSVVGAWTHLLPALSSGTPERHAGQRRVLGRAARARLAGLNLGVLLLSIGLPASRASVTQAGAILAGVTLLVDLALFLRASRVEG